MKVEKNPKYVVNGRFLNIQNTGIGRFAMELCRALRKKSFPFVIVAPEKYKKKIENPFQFDIDYFGNYESHIWEQIELPRYLRKKSRPILLSFSGIGPVFYKNKIITIHDLSFYVNPSWFTKTYNYFYRTLTPIAARNSKKILTVSNFSKSEIVKFLKIKEDRISVIHNATNFHTLSYERIPENKYGKYILGVFSLDPRKNYRLLIDAFKKLKIKDTKLVLVGKKFANFNIQQEELIHEQNIIFTGHVEDKELFSLYKHTVLFVYPSLYEGFGIPPLEALAFGNKVLLSDIPVFREIFGNEVVHYFENNNADDFALKMQELLEHPKHPSAQKTEELLKYYDWSRSAEKLVNEIQLL